MAFFTRFILFLSLALTSITAIAQAPSESNNPVYGYDPLLYNGRMYYFYPQPGTLGTQFLFDNYDTLGSVTVRGVTYTNLTLNYDIYNQVLVLKYKNAIGSSSLIQISFAWLEKASVWGINFETFTKPNSTKSLYQIIGRGDEKVMYFQSTDLLMDNLKGSRSHYFSAIRKEMYVLTKGQLISFKTNKGFIKAFSLSKQSLIKAYLRDHDIMVKTATDFTMAELINYCNTLSGS